jgi:hypothetical protein
MKKYISIKNSVTGRDLNLYWVINFAEISGNRE